MADDYCDVCEQQFKDPRGLAAHNRFKHAPTSPAANGAYDDDVTAGFRAEVQADPETAVTPEEGERRPQVSRDTPKAKPGLFDRIRRETPKDGGPATTPKVGERKPATPKPRRVSTQDFWGDLIEAGSGMVARTGYVPMSRAMAMTSPVGGEIIEDATKGTVIDKAVQPLVRNAEKWQDLADYLGFIAAIGVAQAQPEKAPMALTFARKRLVNLLPKIAANVVKQRQKERKAAEAIQTLLPEFEELQLGDDPVTGLIDMLFAAPEQPPAQPEPAVA